MFDPEQLAGLLEELEQAKIELASERRSKFNPAEYPNLCLAVSEVLGWSSTAYTDLPAAIGISATLLNKFVKMRGEVATHTARTMVDRLRTYVKSLDGVTAPNRPEDSEQASPPKSKTKQPAKGTFKITAQEWALVQRPSNIAKQITAISCLLDNIVFQVQNSNLPDAEQVLTEIERQQLIAILETTLSVLKAPLVEKGLLSRTVDALKSTAASATEKGVQVGVGSMASEAIRRLTDLLSQWF